MSKEKAGRASEFLKKGAGGSERRGKIGRTLRGGSPVSQADSREDDQKPRSKPVRITVDLDPELHRFLKMYALDSGARGAAVVRALLAELKDDPELSSRVTERLSETGR